MEKKPLIFIGLMGCGKSAIGKRLGEKLGRPFLDSDKVIEEKAGKTISKIFAEDGEAAFRKLEKETIAELLTNQPDLILATGGGAFIQDDTRALIQKMGTTFWINAPFEILLERVSRNKKRPLLEKGDKASILKQLMKEREPFYQQADFTVESTDGPHSIVINRIIKLLEK